MGFVLPLWKNETVHELTKYLAVQYCNMYRELIYVHLNSAGLHSAVLGDWRDTAVNVFGMCCPT